MNAIDAVTGNQQDVVGKNQEALANGVDGYALQKAEDLLAMAEEAKLKLADQPEQLAQTIKEIGDQVMSDPALAELVAGAGASNQPDSRTSEIKEAGEPSVVEQISKTVAACDSLEGVDTFLKYYMVPPDTLSRFDDKEIAKYLQEKYPNLLQDIRAKGLDATPTDPDSRGNFQQWAATLRSEKGRSLNLSDFSLPDMPEGMKIRIQEFLASVIDSFVTKAKEYWASRARSSERRLLGCISDTSEPIAKVNQLEEQDIARDKQRLHQSPWLTVEEVDTAYTQHDVYHGIFNRVTADLMTTLPAISDEVITSPEARKGFADRYIQDDADLQSHPDLSRAMSLFITNLLRSESRDRKIREAEKRQQEQEILDQYKWSIAPYHEHDQNGKEIRNSPVTIQFGIAEKSANPRQASDIFRSQPIGFTEGTGVWALSWGKKIDLKDALKPVIDKLIVKRHQEVVKEGKRRFIDENVVATDVHAYLQGVNDGYVDQSSPTDTSETYLDGFAKGQSLKSSVA